MRGTIREGNIATNVGSQASPNIVLAHLAQLLGNFFRNLVLDKLFQPPEPVRTELGLEFLLDRGESVAVFLGLLLRRLTLLRLGTLRFLLLLRFGFATRLFRFLLLLLRRCVLLPRLRLDFPRSFRSSSDGLDELFLPESRDARELGRFRLGERAEPLRSEFLVCSEVGERFVSCGIGGCDGLQSCRR